MLLTRQEQEQLRSLATIICDNAEYISVFATDDLAAGHYIGRVKTEPRIQNRMQIVGYSGDERVTSFTIIGGSLQTEDGREFLYGSDFPHLHLLLEVWPFALRNVRNLWGLRGFLTAQQAVRHIPHLWKVDFALRYSQEWPRLMGAGRLNVRAGRAIML